MAKLTRPKTSPHLNPLDVEQRDRKPCGAKDRAELARRMSRAARMMREAMGIEKFEIAEWARGPKF